MAKAANTKTPSIKPASTFSWRTRVIIASAVVGGFAFMYSSHLKSTLITVPTPTNTKIAVSKTPLGTTFAGASCGHPFFVPKHPVRLFPADAKDDKGFLDAATKSLVENQYSLKIASSPILKRLDQVSVASNEPCEDRHSENSFALADKSVLHVFGVYDGHSGWENSDTVRKFIPTYMRDALLTLKKIEPAAVMEAIKKAMVNVDNEIRTVALSNDYGSTQKSVTPALAGAVVCMTAIINNDLFIANTGDVRAVLGRASKDSKKIQAIDLSIDHTASNPDEVKRMVAEHPGEPESVLLARGRVLGGLMPTRSFGDSSYKWKTSEIEELAARVTRRGNGQIANRIRPIPLSKTPPYVTAEPEMFHRQLTKEDKFIILASDGLWDFMSSEEAVAAMSTYSKEARADENAAAYLVRKSCEKIPDVVKHGNPGLQPSDYSAKLMSIAPPYSRNYRDDITITVIILDDAAYENKIATKNELPVHESTAHFPLYAEQFAKVNAKL